MSKEQLINIFGREWYEELKDTLNSSYFSKLGSQIAKDRKTKTIYPDREDLFKAFRLTPYNHLLRAVIISQDPYPNSTACGVAFGIKYGTTKIPPSLRRIKEEVIDDIYEGEEWPFDYTLTKWANQGVLLINTALTVEEGKPGSHIDLWKEFSEKVLNILNKKNDLVYLCMGKFAENLVNQHITNLSCAKIIVPHPSPLCTSASFKGTKPFSRVNEELSKRNKQSIVW